MQPTGRPRGFGFICYVESADADAVLEMEHFLDGRRLDVKRAVPPKEDEVSYFTPC
jgi:heterogeneous nuclear ribonucleoprotein A1/A3